MNSNFEVRHFQRKFVAFAQNQRLSEMHISNTDMYVIDQTKIYKGLLFVLESEGADWLGTSCKSASPAVKS